MNQNKKIAEKKSRPYQQECIDKVDSLKEGRFLIALATGLGKTWIFSHFKRYGRVLILSHRDELVNQPRRYFDCSFGVEKAENHSNGEEVVSASVQTLSHDSRLKQYKPDDFHTIIIDEAHHAAAPSYKKILNYFSGAKRVIGVTATPKRSDNVRLDDVFNEIIYAKDLRWGIKNKYLSPVHCREVRAKYSLKGVKKSMGDFNVSDLDGCITEEAVISVAKVLTDCLQENRHILIYCTTVRTCNFLKAVVDKLLPGKERGSVAVLSGKTQEEDRKNMLDGFMNGSVRAIINCMVLTEGTDLPITDTIINFRPTCNASLYQQIIGRGTRLYEGKENCLCIDILPDDGSGTNLCTALTLFGIDAKLLGKKQSRMLEGETDPLEISDEIAGRFAELTKAYEYRLEQVNRFVQEQEEIISSARKKPHADLNDLAHAVDKYNSKKMDEFQNDYDFLGMDYSLMPDTEHRYCIKPTWNDHIYLADPDVMGNTTVTFDLTASVGKYYIGEMKMQDAISFVHDFCMISPDYMKYSWNVALQDEWGKIKATENQIGRLMNEYDGFHKGNINKLQASRLIDLASRISKMKAEGKMMLITPRMQEKTIDKKKKMFKEILEKELRAKEQGRSEFGEFQSKIFALAEKKKKDEEKLKNQKPLEEEMLENGTITVNIAVFSSKKTASDAQIKFLGNLKDKLKNRGVAVDKKIPYIGMGAEEASVYITILKTLVDRNVDLIKYGKKIYFNPNTIMSVVLKLKDTSSREIKCCIPFEKIEELR